MLTGHSLSTVSQSSFGFTVVGVPACRIANQSTSRFLFQLRDGGAPYVRGAEANSRFGADVFQQQSEKRKRTSLILDSSCRRRWHRPEPSSRSENEDRTRCRLAARPVLWSCPSRL